MLDGMSAREFEEWKLLEGVRVNERKHAEEQARQGMGRGRRR